MEVVFHVGKGTGKYTFGCKVYKSVLKLEVNKEDAVALAHKLLSGVVGESHHSREMSLNLMGELTVVNAEDDGGG